MEPLDSPLYDFALLSNTNHMSIHFRLALSYIIGPKNIQTSYTHPYPGSMFVKIEITSESSLGPLQNWRRLVEYLLRYFV